MFDPPPLASSAKIRGYNIEFDVCNGRPTLTLVGDLSTQATDALRGILSCVDETPGTLHVDAAGVLGADLDAFDPLLDLARERRQRRQPGVVVDSFSEPVRQLLDVVGLPSQLPVELLGTATAATATDTAGIAS
jgi:ABC-type transporter Mla MlaB component